MTWGQMMLHPALLHGLAGSGAELLQCVDGRAYDHLLVDGEVQSDGIAPHASADASGRILLGASVLQTVVSTKGIRTVIKYANEFMQARVLSRSHGSISPPASSEPLHSA